MKTYDIEISGSVTAHKTATGHAELIEATRHALGIISVVCDGREVVCGNYLDVSGAIGICEEYGYELGEIIGEE